MSNTFTNSQSVTTSCKDCIFAVYDGDTQKDCSLGRIDKFKEKGVVIEAYDEEKEFYVIRGMFCMACRDTKWGQEHSKLKEIWADIVKKQMEVCYHVIILLRRAGASSLVVTLESLLEQEIPPKKVTVVRKPSIDISPAKIANTLKKYPWRWKIQNVVEDFNDGYCIDIVLNHEKKIPFYIEIESGYMFPQEFSTQFNNSINEELVRFPLAQSNSVKIVPSAIHLAYQGNQESSLKDKLEKDNLGQHILEPKELALCLK